VISVLAVVVLTVLAVDAVLAVLGLFAAVWWVVTLVTARRARPLENWLCPGCGVTYHVADGCLIVPAIVHADQCTGLQPAHSLER
jgi:hypothetical protein